VGVGTQTWTLLLPLISLLAKDGPPALDVEGALEAVTPVTGVVMESVQSLASLDASMAVLWGVASLLLADPSQLPVFNLSSIPLEALPAAPPVRRSRRTPRTHPLRFHTLPRPRSLPPCSG